MFLKNIKIKKTRVLRLFCWFGSARPIQASPCFWASFIAVQPFSCVPSSFNNYIAVLINLPVSARAVAKHTNTYMATSISTDINTRIGNAQAILNPILRASRGVPHLWHRSPRSWPWVPVFVGEGVK